MASKYAMTSRGSGRRYLKDEDFEEGDVWGVMESTELSPGAKMGKIKDSSSYPSSSSAPSRIARATNFSIKEANHQLDAMVKQAAAPMEVPDRSWKTSISGSKVDHDGSWLNCGHGIGYGDDDGGNNNSGDDDDDDDDGYEDEEEELIPPHEYIARRLARSQISSFSVCEGIGRTLKGRDLSQVRNDILRRTGFLES